MPRINFDLRGKINGANVEWVLDKKGNKVDVRDMSVYDLIENLDRGELVLDPYHYLQGNNKSEWLEAYIFGRDRNDPDS